MPWGSDAAFKTPVERQELSAEMSVRVPPGRQSGRTVELAPVADMVHQAQQRWGRDNIGRVTLTNPGDAAARVIVVRGDFERASVSPQYLMFDGTSGKLLQVKDHVGPAAETRGVVYALHLGRFADITVRWLYFIVSLAGTAMVGTGLVMWTVKRRSKLPDPNRPHLGFWLVERLSIAAIAGLSIAMTAFLWGNRLLPVGIAQRGEREIDLFFMVWAVTLVHAALRPAKKAWLEQLWCATALLALLPVLNALTTDRDLFTSIAAGDWVFAGFDLTVLALATLHGVLAIRTARHKARAKPFRRTALQVGEEAA
jgi:uncharacterized iron-regulated membrane protein